MRRFMRLDDTDRRLLRLLQANPAQPMAALAERAGLAEAGCARRLERLRNAGVLKGRSAVIDWRKLGWEVEVSLRITLDKTDPRAFDEFIAAAREVPEVLEIQTFLGRVDVRLNVIARDLAHYQQIYRERILTLPHIADIEALMHIADIKKGEALPI
ncbi:MAG: Lrp/AsnC family transcriptional regulator [Pararhodobacter sp.]|nr:Lrp/AsnC family transcriptional regulator [Pararhodobacter sp.]